MHKIEFLLLIIPVLIVFPYLILYRFQGKKDVLHLDLVQFLYNFVFTPLAFIWLKTIFYTLLSSNPAHELSSNQLFLADSLFSLVMFYLYAFFTMHSLTKTFHLKNFDPLYNLFYHSEYIHLWLSHIVMFLGPMLLITVLAITNLFFPLVFNFSQSGFYLTLFLALILGIATYFVLLISEPLQQKRLTLSRLIKLGIGIFFSAHLVAYLLAEPIIGTSYLFYWCSLMFFAGAFITSVLDYRSKKTKVFFQSIISKIKHRNWGNNIQLFADK